MLKGRSISPGKARGQVLKLEEPFSFLGGVDGSTGELTSGKGNVAGRVLVFPAGKGSTVGSYVMYDLAVHGKAPAAVINSNAETIVTTGAVISSIPMVDRIDVSLLSDGDTVTVDADGGTVDIEGVDTIESVSSAILVDGKVLMLKRPDTARSFPGVWSLVAGKIEYGESPVEASVREIMEETGIHVHAPDRSGKMVAVREKNTVWKVYPFLFRLKSAEPKLNHENVGFEWVDPKDIPSRKTVRHTHEAVVAMLDI
ncbi:MAG: DUF126 domain-containing protein [Candidatus Methanomethylophilaceae archaeon]|jgi:predicted aconitase with swiveling domain/ADP-ribose pyrophosphatase YjhB (NUDIX family)|nr:DUF126 domain-containing protein [Candidatus Methanomethylophilaceae archaeon]MDD4709550.1 DUF126 domain-containing protein [Candidatus Methanomethylophilaceae archaeon]MDY0252313.1 DUF126 domain-containing protein [Candidatus Methanomethylophilaceae archaeon]